MFDIHGEWEILVTENCVLQWFSGNWNEEAAIAYTKEFTKKTKHLAGTKWCILSTFENWEAGVPEIESHIIKHCQRFKESGCIKDCHVYSENAFKKMQLEHMIPQSEGNYERRVFANFDGAKSWLESYGFKVDLTDFLNNINQKNS